MNQGTAARRVPSPGIRAPQKYHCDQVSSYLPGTAHTPCSAQFACLRPGLRLCTSSVPRVDNTIVQIRVICKAWQVYPSAPFIIIIGCSVSERSGKGKATPFYSELCQKARDALLMLRLPSWSARIESFVHADSPCGLYPHALGCSMRDNPQLSCEWK